MSIDLYLAFVGACILLSVTPGPNMSLFVANGAAHGVPAALATVAGTTAGNGLLALITVAGMAAVVTILADWFDWVRWLGALYLIWLGVQRVRLWWAPQSEGIMDQAHVPRLHWFLQGLAVSLSNPKVLLFLGALFPQFVDASSGGSTTAQLMLLGVTFVAVTTLIDGVLAISVASAKAWFNAKRQRAANGLSGLFLILGGVWLAAAQKP